MNVAKPDAKTRLLEAALAVIRTKGYTATSVDDLCREAGVTKGAFFHYFRSKEDLAVAAAKHFGAMAEAVFAEAPYRGLADPVERLLGYVEFRAAILEGDLPEYTCLLGTMLQEVYSTHPAIREACAGEITAHLARLEADVAAAQAATGRARELSPAGLAEYTQAVLQGAFILAKAAGGPAGAAESLGHLRRYLEWLFRGPEAREFLMSIAVQTPETTEAETEVRAVIDALVRALHAKDANAVAALYTPDAFVADLAPPLVHRGIDPSGLQSWLDGWEGPVDMHAPDLEVVADGGLALCQGLIRISTRRDGEAAEWWSRSTYGLRRQAGGWRIIHEHNSVPFYMDGSERAAIDLQP